MATTQPRLGMIRHVVLVAIPVVVAAMVMACGSDDDAESGADDDSADTTTSTTEPEDLVMQDGDFVRLQDMTPVRGFFIDNRLGHLDEAIAVANDPEGGVYPVGTIIQLVPFEAMVKRAPGFAPETGDWEFFFLEVSAEGTRVVDRGSDQVVNQFGGNCASCHDLAEPEFDFVCEDTHGCEPLPIGDDVIRAVQEADPRPPAPADAAGG